MKKTTPALCEGTKVEIIFEGDSLIFAHEHSGERMVRWPVACVSIETVSNLHGQESLRLSCPPDSLRLEVLQEHFKNAEWRTLLPGVEKHHPYKKGFVWISAALATAAALTWGIPVLITFLPFSIEKKIFSKFSLVPDSNLCIAMKGEPGGEALKKLVGRVYPRLPVDKEFPIEVNVAFQNEVNAFAAPGGHIYINSGLLRAAKSGDEVAGVLSHEITHVLKRHVLKSAADQILILLILPKLARLASLTHLKFNRNQESDADQAALERLKVAGVSAQGFRDFFERLAKDDHFPEFLSDHPAMQARVEHIKVDPLSQTTPVLSEVEFKSLQRLCKTSL